MRTLLSVFAVTTFVSLSGCQCCGLTEHYADKVDNVSDYGDFRRGLDSVYCEKLDPQRWCMNRRCPRSNCPQCQARRSCDFRQESPNP